MLDLSNLLSARSVPSHRSIEDAARDGPCAHGKATLLSVAARELAGSGQRNRRVSTPHTITVLNVQEQKLTV